MQDEGHEVFVYIAAPKMRRVGIGIVPLATSKEQWEAWARSKPSETIVLFDASAHGDMADRLRKAGLRVVGAGGLCDRMEEDRRWAFRMAKLLGMKVPDYREFGRVSEAIAFLKGQSPSKKWYFKPNRELGPGMTFGATRERLVPFLRYVERAYGDRIAHVLQAEVKGTAISTAGWWNGRTFLAPYEGTIEHKKLMNDEVGPSTGCSFNVLWFYEEDEPEIVRRLHFATFAEYLRREEAPAGVYDINAVISEADGEPYFLEHTPRCGYDAEPTAQALLDPQSPDGELGAFLAGLANGTLREAPFVRDEAALSIRVTIPPYPLHDTDALRWRADPPLLGVDGLWDGNFVAYGVGRVKGEYVVVDPSGEVGLSLARGTDLAVMGTQALAYLDEEFWAPDAQYRTDAVAVLRKDLEAVRRSYPQTAAMLTLGEA